MKTTTRKPAAKKAAPPAKRKPGRPTHYRPEYCDIVVELGRQGKSFAQMAVACDAVRDTLKDWATKHEEFAAAIARARELSLAWWEEQSSLGLWESPEGQRLNAHIWARSISARFPDEYRESKKTELSGPGGGPVQAAITIVSGVPDA